MHFFLTLITLFVPINFYNKKKQIMSIKRNLKNDIVQMRNEGKSYREIKKILDCSKGTIQYHCKILNMVDIGKKKYPVQNETKKNISEYFKNHSLIECAKVFNLSISTINNYKNYHQEQTIIPTE